MDSEENKELDLNPLEENFHQEVKPEPTSEADNTAPNDPIMMDFSDIIGSGESQSFNKDYIGGDKVKGDKVEGNQYNYFIGKPTEQLQVWGNQGPIGNLKVSSEKIKKFSKKLLDNNILLLYSPDELLLSDTTEFLYKYISSLPNYNKSKRHFLSWDAEELKENNEQNQIDDLGIDYFSNPHVQKSDTPVFIKVKLSNLYFFKTIYKAEGSRLDSIKSSLKANNIFLICEMQRSLLSYLKLKTKGQNDDFIEKIMRKSEFPFEFIPFLETYISHYFPKESEKLIREIYQQQERGQWGTKNNREELRDEIVKGLKGDPNKLKDKIEYFSSPEYEKDKSVFLKNLNKEPNKTVLFIIAFFQDVNISEFRTLINELLDERTKSVEVEEEILDHEKKVHILKKDKEIPLFSLWKGKEEIILQECKVKIKTLIEGSRCLDFKDISLDGDVRKHFIDHPSFYLIEQYQKLASRDYFFNIDKSERFIKRFQELLLDIAPYDLNKYTYEVLLEIYLRLANNQIEVSVSSKNELTLEDIAHIRAIQDFKRETGFKRFIQLLNLMLSKEKSIYKGVYRFMELLFDKDLHRHLLIIIEELSVSNKIDLLDWLQKILNKNIDPELYQRIINLMERESRTWEGQTFQKLKIIYGWLPNEIDKKKFTHTHLAAVQFIYTIANPIEQRFPLRFYGEWPPKFNVLTPLKELNDVNEYISFLIQWLFDPRALAILKKSTSVKNIEIEKIDDVLMSTKALILESWSLIITGIDQKPLLENINANFQKHLIEAIREHIPFKEVQSLKRHFGLLASSYSEEINKLQYKNDEYSSLILKLFKAKKAMVLFLRDRTKNK